MGNKCFGKADDFADLYGSGSIASRFSTEI